MSSSKTDNTVLKNLHLIISVIFIIPIGLTYGVHPNITLSKLFDINVDTINLTNIFRAMMGLYLATSAIWIIGIIKSTLWMTATITNIVFMGGLALGRLLSLAIDGRPSEYFIIGLIVELILAVWGLINVKKHSPVIRPGG